MKLLSREEILGAEDLPTQVVEVPEWGGSVLVRALTALERANIENSPNMAWPELKMQLVVRCMVDEAGQPIFTTADGPALLAKSDVAFKRVWDVVAGFNGLGNTAKDEAEKASAGAQADGSNGNLPGDSGTPTPT